MINLKLKDGTILENLAVNGSNYISKNKIDESLLTDLNLSEVTEINLDTKEQVRILDLHFVQQVSYDGEESWALAFAQISELDKLKAKLAATEEAVQDLILASLGGEKDA